MRRTASHQRKFPSPEKSLINAKPSFYNPSMIQPFRYSSRDSNSQTPANAILHISITSYHIISKYKIPTARRDIYLFPAAANKASNSFNWLPILLLEAVISSLRMWNGACSRRKEWRRCDESLEASLASRNLSFSYLLQTRKFSFCSLCWVR
jgi:hypothetical protein